MLLSLLQFVVWSSTWSLSECSHMTLKIPVYSGYWVECSIMSLRLTDSVVEANNNLTDSLSISRREVLKSPSIIIDLPVSSF